MSGAFAQNITITVNATQNKRPVSPYIYGRNNTFDKPAAFYKDAGLRFVRMNGGNNATKYNWRRKLTSHPDWYNNVYSSNDWDETSKKITDDHPDMQVMWAFQLLGRAASSKDFNFNDWGFNNSQYWPGVGQNLAGGGTPNTANPGGKASVEGDINLYTMEWPADSSVAILDHWFGPHGLGLNKDQFLYWNMDNEPDVWNGTHDDVMPILISASQFMDRFIELAKKARAKFPEIKICGPVTTSEWQWYKWGSDGITIDGKYYAWLEYFIKRCADEEKASGIRVLDVVDLHNYPWFPTDEDALQLHRMYYDTEYSYPGANGLKTIDGGWDNSQTREYIFKRINNWLDLHFGANHGVTMGISEWSPGPSEPDLASVIYASHLGTFANNGVELFSPWTWFNGMWETLHLYSRYAKGYSVSSTSSLENLVSAYTTINEAADSLTVIIVNRDISSTRNLTVNLNGFSAPAGSYTTLQLSSLPSYETFTSHTNNALKENSISVNSNSFTISVPKLSTTAVLLSKTTSELSVTGIEEYKSLDGDMRIYPNPVSGDLLVSLDSNITEPVEITVYDQKGRRVQYCERYYNGISPIALEMSTIPNGIYILSVRRTNDISIGKFVVIR